MKTSRILKLIVSSKSLSSVYDLNWLKTKLGGQVLDCRVYEDFLVFDLSDTLKSRRLLASLIIYVSLDIDLCGDVVCNGSLIRDFASSLSK